MTKLKYIGALVVAVSAFMSLNAVAADDDEPKAVTYFGAAGGRSAWNINIDGAPGSTKRDSYAGFFIGEEFTKNIGVEGTFYTLGTANITSTDQTNVAVRNGFYSLLEGYYKGKGVDVSLVVKTNPYRKWRAFGKLGLTHVEGSTNAVIRNIQGNAIKGEKFEYNNAITFGFGTMYQFTDHVVGRLEFGKKDVIVAPNSPNTKTTVKNYTAGLQVYF